MVILPLQILMPQDYTHELPYLAKYITFKEGKFKEYVVFEANF